MNARQPTAARRVHRVQEPAHRRRREYERQIKGGGAATLKASKKAAPEIGSRGTLLTSNGPRPCFSSDEGLTAARSVVRANADINRSRPPGAPATSRRQPRRKIQRRVAAGSSCVQAVRRIARMHIQIPAHRMIPEERCIGVLAGRCPWPGPAQQSKGSTS